jgi:addiction module HigA family antidote
MMKNPPHPGGIIRRQILEPLGLTVTRAAKALGVSRPAISNLLNERVALTAEMAIRLEKAFGVDMETLMALQHAYDVALARARADSIAVARYKASTGAKPTRRRQAA